VRAIPHLVLVAINGGVHLDEVVVVQVFVLVGKGADLDTHNTRAHTHNTVNKNTHTHIKDAQAQTKAQIYSSRHFQKEPTGHVTAKPEKEASLCTVSHNNSRQQARPLDKGSSHAYLVGVVAVLDGGVEAHGAPRQVVHGADLEPPTVAAQQAGLLALVAGGPAAHHRSLREHARAAVGVRALLRSRKQGSNHINNTKTHRLEQRVQKKR